jgi:putative zinc finger/helix-turn-helix YgiT family protein
MEAKQVKPFPWMCPQCREKTVVPVQRDYTITSGHDGASYEITLHDVVVPTCSRCGQAIITSDISQAISTELRRVAGLLQPTEIRAKREALGLTPSHVAAALRVGEATFGRWEEGMQLPSRALDLLLRLYFESAEVRQACVALPTTISPLPHAPTSIT